MLVLKMRSFVCIEYAVECQILFSALNAVWAFHMWAVVSVSIPPVLARQTLEQNTQRKWGRGRPRNMWRTAVLGEAKGVNKTWAETKTDAKNRVRWMMEALCSAAE